MKVITKKLFNGEIYQIALNLQNEFNDNEVRMPAAIAYAIQKTKNNFMSIGQEIEQKRVEIIQHYGTYQEDGQILVQAEYIDQANQELGDLLNIEDEIKYYTFSIEELDGIQFTSSQMSAIMFMIDEGETALA